MNDNDFTSFHFPGISFLDCVEQVGSFFEYWTSGCLQVLLLVLAPLVIGKGPKLHGFDPFHLGIEVDASNLFFPPSSSSRIRHHTG